jgi:amino acid transporter
MGPVALTASVLNVVIGAGIFALPAALALVLGSSAPVAFILGGIIMAMIVVCMARAGSRVARSGGLSAYADVAFGPFAGFLTGSLLWFSNMLASAGIASAVAESLATVAPTFAQGLPRDILIVGLYGALTAVNLQGVALAARVTSAAAVIKFLALVAFVVLGASLVNPQNLIWDHAPSATQVGRGVYLAVFAFSGAEIALGASGEVRDPRRTVPIALAAAMVLVALIYLGVQLIAQGALGASLAESSAPLADALTRRGMPGGSLILAAGIISMGGWLAGDLLGTPRILFGFARVGLLPRALARVSPVHHVPNLAIAIHAAVACCFALTGSFVTLAIFSVMATIPVYISCCAAAWVLERREAVAAGRNAPWLSGRSLIPLLAIGSLLWMLSCATLQEVIAVTALLVVTAGIYGGARRFRSEPTP